MSKPIKKYRKKLLEVAQFENDSGSSSFVLQKSWTGKDGKWNKEKITCFPRDLANIKEVIDVIMEDQPDTFRHTDGVLIEGE